MTEPQFKVIKRDSGIEYVAWECPGGFMFTVNDGRVPGGVAQLPTEEFWQTFQRKEGA